MYDNFGTFLQLYCVLIKILHEVLEKMARIVTSTELKKSKLTVAAR